MDDEEKMRITIANRLKALFAPDEYEFWWHHFTDEEKKLRRMDVWELAEVISQKKPNSPESIVAEHMLNVRLAKMQVRATYFNIVVGFVGIVVGAVLSSILR